MSFEMDPCASEEVTITRTINESLDAIEWDALADAAEDDYIQQQMEVGEFWNKLERGII